MLQKRKGCVFALLVTGLLMGGVAWYLLRPKVKFADPAVVRAQIDERLLQPLTLDSTAATRFKEVEKALKKVQLSSAPAMPQDQYLRWALKAADANEENVAGIVMLYESGSVFPKPSDFSIYVPHVNDHRAISKFLTAAALADAAEGRTARALQRMELASRHVRGLAKESRVTIELFVTHALQAIVDHTAAKLARQRLLSEAELTEMLQFLPQSDPDNNIVKQVILGEFQLYTLPMLPKFGRDLDTESRNYLGLSHGEQQGLPPGQYDALETTRLANIIGLTLLDNISKPHPGQDYSFDSQVTALFESLPEDDFSDMEPSAERSAKEFWYTFRMNNRPNSLGLQLLLNLASQFQACRSNERQKTCREAVRAVIALEIYRKRHGKLPASLDELVSEKIVTKLPWDYMADAPLRYDATRDLVWSIGANGKDDKGAVSLDFSPMEADWGFYVRKQPVVKPSRP